MKTVKMIDTIEFDIASIADLQQIIDIKINMFKESGHADLLASNIRDIVLKDYLRLYEKKEALHFIAKSNSKIVAAAGAFVKSDLPFCYYQQGIYGFIGDVYTELPYRGYGTATYLTKEALQWLKSKGIKMVRLLASESGRSIYEKLGFVQSEEMILNI